jgi:hypothetical protein
MSPSGIRQNGAAHDAVYQSTSKKLYHFIEGELVCVRERENGLGAWSDSVSSGS